MRIRDTRALAVTALVVAGAGCGTTGLTDAAARTEVRDDGATTIVEAELDRLAAAGATRAAIVVLDPADGRILAAGGRGSEATDEVRATRGVGSTMKPITIAAALDAGLDPELRFDGEGGEWRAPSGEVLRDHESHDALAARDVITTSSNIGAAKIVQSVGDAPVARAFEAVGARVQPERSWVSHGTGIGVRLSPLALAGAYAAFANGGRVVEPTVDGTGARRRLVSAESADAVRAMLEAAVGDDGTGRRARVDGARVGGKTGTTGDGGAVFAGLAPIDAPRFVIVVRAELPGAYGGSVAAPSFSRVAARLLSR